MTLKPADIIFVCILATLCGIGGAFAIRKYMPPPAPPEAPKVVVFNSGKWLVEKLSATPGITPEQGQAYIVESAKFAAQLSDQGYIVLNGDAVISAPAEALVDPTTQKQANSELPESSIDDETK